jgi:hypothetical protein
MPPQREQGGNTMRAMLTVLPFVLFAVGCSAQGMVKVDVESTSQAQTIARSDPAPVVAQRELHVTLTRVDVHVADADATDDSDRDSPGWATIFKGAREVDLFDKSAVATSLGYAPTPIGKVTQVRLLIGDDAVFVDEFGNHAIQCPSCAETGLKVVTSGQVEVKSDGVLHLTLEFDRDASLVETRTGFALNPVVHLRAVNE